ncbi:MAG: hypothetical protein WBP45_11460, partial [Daejeonella sp.]
MKKEITFPTSGFFMIVNKRACNSRLLSLAKNTTLSLFKKTSLVLFLITLTLSSTGILTAYAQAPNITYPGGAKTYPVGSVITPLTASNTGDPVPANIYITSTFASGFSSPRGIAMDAAGNLYVAENTASRIKRITPQGVVSVFAGGNYGTNNGTGIGAEFTKPEGLAIDAAGFIYVTDDNGNQVRKITTPGAVVSTLAGSGSSGSNDGPGVSATFSSLRHVAVDASGNLYVADSGNNKIRKITPAGDVSVFAGTGSTLPTSMDGLGSSATFNSPNGIATDASGNLYIADTYNHNIRKITPAGDVSTIAGSGGYNSNDHLTNPLLAGFIEPRGLTIDALGNIYVVDQNGDGNGNKVRKISTSGEVSTVAGNGSSAPFANGVGTAANFNSPKGIITDASGNLYVSDTG